MFQWHTPRFLAGGSGRECTGTSPLPSLISLSCMYLKKVPAVSLPTPCSVRGCVPDRTPPYSEGSYKKALAYSRMQSTAGT